MQALWEVTILFWCLQSRNLQTDKLAFSQAITLNNTFLVRINFISFHCFPN